MASVAKNHEARKVARFDRPEIPIWEPAKG
jgi:hypothetical protein